MGSDLRRGHAEYAVCRAARDAHNQQQVRTAVAAQCDGELALPPRIGGAGGLERYDSGIRSASEATRCTQDGILRLHVHPGVWRNSSRVVNVAMQRCSCGCTRRPARHSLLLSLLFWLTTGGPTSEAAQNGTCVNRAHCEYASPLSKYICGISTDSALVGSSFPPSNISGTEQVITNATCVTTEVPECDGATGSRSECVGAGPCTYTPASGDNSATCTTTIVEDCGAEEATESAAACFEAGDGACTFTPPTYTDPDTTHPTVFMLCTLGVASGCTGANFGTPACELPPGVRDSLPEVKRTVGDPHLASDVQNTTGMTEAQLEAAHGVSVQQLAAQSTSNYWKATIATQQCATMCTGTEDTFEHDCLDLNNAVGTVKEVTEDGSDFCDHRACASSLAAIRQALMYGC